MKYLQIYQIQEIVEGKFIYVNVTDPETNSYKLAEVISYFIDQIYENERRLEAYVSNNII